MGFQDVVVNLAPASRNSSAIQSPAADEMTRNADGDVVGANGARVDVAFLLKAATGQDKVSGENLEGDSFPHFNLKYADIVSRGL